MPVATINPTRRPTAAALQGKQDDAVGRHWWRRPNATHFRTHQRGRVFSFPGPSPWPGIPRDPLAPARRPGREIHPCVHGRVRGDCRLEAPRLRT